MDMKTIIFSLFFFWGISAYCIGQNKVAAQMEGVPNQGVAVDKDYYYCIFNTKVTKRSKKDGKLIAEWKADKSESYKHFSHMNSGIVIDGKLYCTHSNKSTGKNTMEIWDVSGKNLKHIKTLRLKATIKSHGYITWADKKSDGSWWVCYAVYGKKTNSNTLLLKCELKDGDFAEKKRWKFPAEVVKHWGRWSCSGGSWGPDGLLYTTSHDGYFSLVLKIDEGKLKYLRKEEKMGFYGQGICWDRTEKKQLLWGIRKHKNVSATLIPRALNLNP